MTDHSVRAGALRKEYLDLGLRNSQEDDGSVSSQNGGFTEISPFLQDLPELSFSYDILSPLVERFLSSTPALGLYSIIPACTSLELSHDHPLELAFGDLLLQPEVRCTLVAVALELYGHTASGYKVKRAIIDRDSLHFATLSSIQNISLRNDQLTAANALCLLLLSYTWFTTEQFAESSLRWCALARIVLDHGHGEMWNQSLYAREQARRTNIGLSLQECSLSLAQNCVDTILRPRVDSNISLPFVTDDEWHSISQSSNSHTYLALFNPFISIVKNIVQEHLIGSPPWIKTESQLEDYFFQFPEDLLQFSTVKYTYQFEAMIWLHGLFIILHSTRDIINLLKMTIYIETDRFCHILEHSLLLGEILQPMLSMDASHIESISPTTIYFICLSSTVHCIALRQFIAQSECEHISLPDKLIESTKSHIEMLETLQSSYRRGDQLLVREIKYLLSSCLDAAANDREADVVQFSCENLYTYRWTHRGTGMVKMGQESAKQEWNYVEAPEESLWDGITGMETELIVAILQLCSSTQRICSSEYFDLSIMIPM
ncbi:hypothetical protein N7478_009885 [Penicillium angulare]|uniref:uncharacterized protein n=1 Tax=Penicillium angulare TaxID=116970 RepID=UPI0025408E59|nr:uncharacterized protein N7478_009885 [Penicillium angulare]KAJ5267077.1 hypothetical protein N7478_009885 [Penicillium angulare]